MPVMSDARIEPGLDDGAEVQRLRLAAGDPAGLGRGVQRRGDEPGGDDHQHDPGDAEEARQVEVHAAAVDHVPEDDRHRDPEHHAEAGRRGVVVSLNAASRNTAVSKPSRRTAKNAIPTSALVVPVCERPGGAATAAGRAGRARGCVIQTIMHVTIATATSATIVSSPSCARCGSWSSTTRARRRRRRTGRWPAPTPTHIARSASVRPVRRRNAAMIPTISDASRPSRRPMTNVVSMLGRRP